VDIIDVLGEIIDLAGKPRRSRNGSEKGLAVLQIFSDVLVRMRGEVILASSSSEKKMAPVLRELGASDAIRRGQRFDAA
jgi:hypothetical protein